MVIHNQIVQTFTNYLLLGMTTDEESMFYHSVVYVCEHGEEGALGIILNKEIDLKMLDLFKKLELEISPNLAPEVGIKGITIGGPNEAERGFVLHTSTEEHYVSSINRTLSLTTSLDVLEQIANGQGPEKFLMALGCANWSSGQLEKEMRGNSWLAMPASLEIIFDIPAKNKYEKVLEMLGIKPWQLSLFSGNS